MVEGVLILQNSSRKLKTVADNAILLNLTASSENISERIKVKTENGFHLKTNVCKIRRIKAETKNSCTADIYIFFLIALSKFLHRLYTITFPVLLW